MLGHVQETVGDTEKRRNKRSLQVSIPLILLPLIVRVLTILERDCVIQRSAVVKVEFCYDTTA